MVVTVEGIILMERRLSCQPNLWRWGHESKVGIRIVARTTVVVKQRSSAYLLEWGHDKVSQCACAQNRNVAAVVVVNLIR